MMNDPDDDNENLYELLTRAERGDAEVLPRLRALLAEQPDLWRYYADLGGGLEAQLICLACGDNLLLREALARRVEDLKRELAGSRPAPLSRLLAQRAALGWLETHYHDTLAAQNPGLSGPRTTELRRRRHEANGRYLGALKALALVQKFLPQPGSRSRKARPC